MTSYGRKEKQNSILLQRMNGYGSCLAVAGWNEQNLITYPTHFLRNNI